MKTMIFAATAALLAFSASAQSSALADQALTHITTGSGNIVPGYVAGQNTAIGVCALDRVGTYSPGSEYCFTPKSIAAVKTDCVLAVGKNAGIDLESGDHVILIGENAQAPKQFISYYIRIHVDADDDLVSGKAAVWDFVKTHRDYITLATLEAMPGPILQEDISYWVSETQIELARCYGEKR